MVNSVDIDQMLRSAATDLGLHSLFSQSCLCEYINTGSLRAVDSSFFFSVLTFVTLWENSADDKLMIFLLVLPR